ncbi:MAG: heme-binding domain-containing protein, partial [Rikenellaceae bacterium]|nr:heme-binding domain-containing protein [Rikenellaceae bacterium]
MKKSKLLILALVLAVVLVAVYRISNRPPSAEYTPEARVAAILVKGGCLDCHTKDAEYPFYADFPIAGKIVRQDIDSGFRAFDIEPLYEALVAGQLPRPVDVAKVEKVALDKRMPEPKYYLVHWGSQMTDAKRDIIVEWARKYRAEYYADGVEGERAGEPVRPIAEPTDIDARKALLGYALYH